MPATSSGSRMLAVTLRQGSRAESWKAMPRWCLSRATAGSSPCRSASPAVGFSSPARMRSTVDLPQPEGPSRERKELCEVRRSTPLRAVRDLRPSLNSFVRPVRLMPSDKRRVFLLDIGEDQEFEDLLGRRRETSGAAGAIACSSKPMPCASTHRPRVAGIGRRRSHLLSRPHRRPGAMCRQPAPVTHRHRLPQRLQTTSPAGRAWLSRTAPNALGPRSVGVHPLQIPLVLPQGGVSVVPRSEGTGVFQAYAVSQRSRRPALSHAPTKAVPTCATTTCPGCSWPNITVRRQKRCSGATGEPARPTWMARPAATSGLNAEAIFDLDCRTSTPVPTQNASQCGELGILPVRRDRRRHFAEGWLALRRGDSGGDGAAGAAG